MNNLEKIAVVIDADNTQLSKIGDVLREISTYGRIVVKRAYGNWRKGELKNWETEIKRLAIKAIQQFDYVAGKNATDMALVIDTIELLYTNIYDAFVIVSSDSDYTPLAIKLRESGLYVMGVGEKKSPISFINACDEFLLLENISASSDGTQTKRTVPVDKIDKSNEESNGEVIAATVNAGQDPVDDSKTDSNDTSREIDNIDEIHNLLRSAYTTYQDENGFANVAPVGAFIKRAKPDFDCRTYGYMKLPELLEAFSDKYEITRYPGKGTVTIVAYRCID